MSTNRKTKKPAGAAGKGGARAKGGTRTKHVAWVGTLEVVLVDEEPLRTAELKKYRTLEGSIGKARVELDQFEQRDVPAHQRWEAVTLGSLLTELRAIRAELEQKHHLLFLVDDEMMWTGCTRETAYRRVMDARARAERGEAPQEPREDEGEGEEGFEDFAEGEDPRVFGEHFLPGGKTAADYEKMKPAQKRRFQEEYEAMAELYEMMTGLEAPSFEEALELSREQARARAGGAPPRGSAGDRDGYDFGYTEHDHAREKEEEGPREKRLKSLYRRLVRELHPDLHGEMSAHERELWHQLQAAWDKRDLEAMEALAGRVEMGVRGEGRGLSLQTLRRMVQDLRASLQGLREQVRRAREHPAWGFLQLSAAKLEAVAKRQLRGLKQELDRGRADLALATRVLEELERKTQRKKAPAAAKKKKPAAKKAGAGKAAGRREPMQEELF